MADSLPASGGPDVVVAATVVLDAPTLAAPVEEPVVLPCPMPSAARVTTEPQGLAAALEKYGTVRAAARALGVAESTLRGRCRKAGVKLPGRRKASR